MSLTDNVKSATKGNYAETIIQRFCCNGRIFIAGNISDKKDLDIVCYLANRLRNQKFIFVPEEICEEKLNEIIASIEGKCKLCSECYDDTDFSDIQVLIIDFLGSSPWIYRYCTYAYISGRSIQCPQEIKNAVSFGLHIALGPGPYRCTCPVLIRPDAYNNVHSGKNLYRWFIETAARELPQASKSIDTVKGGVAYSLLAFFLKWLSRIPFRAIYALSDGLYPIVYHVVRYRRKIVRRNLTEAYPDKGKSEIKHIERKFYRFFSDLILESCKLATISPAEIQQRMSFKNTEEINSLLKRGKSVAIYLGHYGNWEWVSSLPLWLEKGVIGAQIYHRLSNEDIDRLMKTVRERMGAISIDMHNTARYITKLSNSHNVCAIGFIADQSPRIKDTHHYLHFLRHTVPVITGTEKIIKHFGFEAFYLEVKRIKRGYYQAEFIKIHDNPQTLPDFGLTDLFFQHLEHTIMSRPELYLWSHKRFRSAKRDA